MAQRYRYKESSTLTGDPGGDYTGGISDGMDDLDYVWGDGTGSDQADAYYYDSRTLGAGANEDLDLQALSPGPAGANVNFTEVRKLKIRVPDTAQGELELSPSAGTPWLAFLKDATDVIIIEPGATLTIETGVDGFYPVTAGAKSINITNTDGANAVTYEILAIGTTA